MSDSNTRRRMIVPPSGRSQAPPPRTPTPAAAAASGYEGVSRYASEPLPRELQMGDVFPGKTRGPRAEKQPYVPDPLPKGVQSMGDVLPGMTKPARPVRKRQEPGRWDGVGEKPSPKPCQDCRPPQSVRRGEATQFKAGNYFGKPSRPKKIKVSAAGAEIRALDTYANRVDIKKNDAMRGAIVKEKLEHDRAHIYLAKLWEEKWTAAKLAQPRQAREKAGEKGRRKERLWEKCVSSTKKKFPDINWVNEKGASKYKAKQMPPRIFSMRQMEQHLAKPLTEAETAAGLTRADIPPNRRGQRPKMPKVITDLVRTMSDAKQLLCRSGGTSHGA